MKDAYLEIARIDARVRVKLLKLAGKQGMTNQDEVIELVEAWKEACSRKPPVRQRSASLGADTISIPIRSWTKV